MGILMLFIALLCFESFETILIQLNTDKSNKSVKGRKIEYKSNNISNENELSQTFRVVGPNIDSTVDTGGNKYKDFYLQTVSVFETNNDFKLEKTKYNSELTNKNRFKVGNYGKTRITRFKEV